MKAKVTEQVFNTVKLMTKGGATITQCCEATGTCPATVSIMRKANTYEEYKELMHKNSGGYKKKLKREAELKALETALEESKTAPEEPVPQVVEHHETITLIANQYLAEELKKQTELLTLINNKLTLIAEDLGCFRDEKISNG